VSTVQPAEIESVRPASSAARAGLLVGDRLLSVNGRAPRDYIDYRYLTAEPRVHLLLEGAEADRRRVTITKSVDDDLGLRFTQDIFDGIITCGNRCPFCFVAQLPGGLRPALYVRDDDYRLSFLHGSFITLTNLTHADRSRIAQLHLSPLYVSVHATETEVRRRIFGGAVPDALDEMRCLIREGIEFHTQIVLCPGLNDGDHLARTVADLAALHPGLRSVGLVPVGLTKHRRGGAPLRAVTPAYARRLIESVRHWQRQFLRSLGTRLVFAADELYLLIGVSLPGRAQYEGFPQLGNGIGCARLFIDRVRRLRPPRLARPLRVTLVTGEMAAPLVERLAKRLREGDVSADMCVVRNRLFGRSVTTAGLLAGRDIAAALRGRKSDLVIIPGTAVREAEGFIDSLTLDGLSRRLGLPVVAANGPGEATAAIRHAAKEKVS
jgi:putative radical SAM enzyme (TIGR03279 family)